MSLPSCPAQAVKGKSLLLVILTDLDQTCQNDLVQHVRKSLSDDTKIQLWHPLKTMLQYVANQDLHQDSSANIYAVAILAYRSGWTSLVVADNLTNRQLNKTQYMGESASISMAMIAVRKSQSALKDQVRVIARRTEESDEEDLLPKLHRFDIVPHVLGEWHHRASRIYEDEGFELHDPDRCIFIPDSISLLAEELANTTHAALSAKSLPPELILRVLSFTQNHPQSIPKPSWVDHDPRSLQIFLMFPCTFEQLCQMQCTIEHAIQADSQEEDLQDIMVHLIRSSSNGMLTRRDLMHIWDSYHTPYAPDMIFLPEPISDSANLDSIKLIILHAGKYSPLIAVPMTFRTIIQGVCTESISSSVHMKTLSEVSQQPPVTEFMYHPCQPFYTNPHFWHPSDDELPLWVPLFYLTDKLTPEQDIDLRTEIYTRWGHDDDDVENLECTVIPWGRHRTQGTVEDMWSIVWHVHAAAWGSSVIFFVDEQSGRDQSLVIAQADIISDLQLTDEVRDIIQKLRDPNLRGFWYCRIPGRQSHSAIFNLEMLGGEIGDLVVDGNAQRFARPGWPHHLVEV